MLWNVCVLSIIAFILPFWACYLARKCVWCDDGCMMWHGYHIVFVVLCHGLVHSRILLSFWTCYLARKCAGGAFGVVINACMARKECHFVLIVLCHGLVCVLSIRQCCLPFWAWYRTSVTTVMSEKCKESCILCFVLRLHSRKCAREAFDVVMDDAWRVKRVSFCAVECLCFVYYRIHFAFLGVLPC